MSEAVDLWDMPFVYELSSGTKPSVNPTTLDATTVREVHKKLRAIDDARAAAIVSGQRYLIRGATQFVAHAHGCRLPADHDGGCVTDTPHQFGPDGCEHCHG